MVATGYAPVVSSPEEIAAACARAMYGEDAASRGVGIIVESVAPGRAVARMAVTAQMVNGHGIGHGGYVFLLADTAFAFACNTYDERTVAAGASVEFLRQVRLGDVLEAEARERTRTGRNGLYDVTVRRVPQSSEGEAEVVAEFRGRSRTIGGPILGNG